MGIIIQPNRNGEFISPEKENQVLKSQIKTLQAMMIAKNNDYQQRLEAMHRDLQKLDKILNEAFEKIDAYGTKLKELGVDLKEVKWKK